MKETCHLPLQEKWEIGQPEIGQCVPSVLIIQDFLGGEIIHDIKNKHYWNKLPDGTELDITRSQFSKNTVFKNDEIIDRKCLFPKHTKTQERYNILKEKVGLLL